MSAPGAAPRGASRSGCRLGAAALLAALVVTGGARAESKEVDAAAAFDDATRRFAAGEYRKAAAAFERAYRLVPHGDAAYNAALSWERAGERPRAAEAFVEALGRDLRAEARADAEERLVKLKRALALVSVVGPDGSVARLGDLRRETPAEFFVEPGLHQVFLEGASEKRSRAVEARAGAEHVVEFREKKTAGAEPEEEPAPRSRRPAAADAGSPWPTIGWTAVAAGAALAGVAALVGLQSQDARDTFNDSNRTDAEKRDRALRLQTWTRIAWASAVVVGGSGVVILLTSGDGPSDGAAGGSSRAALRPVGVGVSGGF